MGLDLTIISNHELNEDLENVKDKVLNKLDFVYIDSDLRDYFKSVTRSDSFKEWNSNSWRFDLMGLKSLKEVVKEDNCICFKGPWAISMRLGLKSYQLDLNLPWYHFLENKVIQTQIFALMEMINQVFKSEYNIYIPDNGTQSSGYSDLVTEGFGLDEILARMKIEIGNPCTSADELISQFNTNENAYLKK